MFSMLLMFTRQNHFLWFCKNLLELFFIINYPSYAVITYVIILSCILVFTSIHIFELWSLDRTFRKTLFSFFFRFLFWNFISRIWWPLIYRYRYFAIFLVIGSDKCHENIFLPLLLFCNLSLKMIKSVLSFMENNFTQNELR